MPSLPSPIGTIAAYAGPVDANLEQQTGWLACDGRPLKPSDPNFKALFVAIGSSWGGDGVIQFHIPDLRGLFLRGVDGAAGRDPDRSERINMQPGGQTGNHVGSFQFGDLGHHTHLAVATHKINGRTFSSSPRATSELQLGLDHGGEFADGNQSGVSRNDPTIAVTVNPAGGKETRPINAYVNWMIRFR